MTGVFFAALGALVSHELLTLSMEQEERGLFLPLAPMAALADTPTVQYNVKS
jgi:hypothetical protein